MWNSSSPFAGEDYRIQRNYGKKSVERVFRFDGIRWNDVELPKGVSPVSQWAQKTLGLTYDQFTASVLLKQDEADRIICGSGKERLQMFKAIIGVERYEKLAASVKDASKTKKDTFNKLSEQLQTVVPITEEQLDIARQKHADAERAVVAAGELAVLAHTRSSMRNSLRSINSSVVNSKKHCKKRTIGSKKRTRFRSSANASSNSKSCCRF